MEKLSIVLAASATLLAQNSALPDSSRNPSNVMMRAFPIGTLVTLNALMNAVAFRPFVPRVTIITSTH
jgi:hypothetical protein